MAYCTLDDLKNMIPEGVLIQLTDDEGTDAVDQDAIDDAVAQADAEIDSYCGTRYTVPFVTVPDVVKKASVDIAIYNLYSRRVEEIPQTRTDRYKNTVRLLEAISRGTISIGVDPAPGEKSEGRAESNTPVSDRTFTRNKLRGF